MRLRKSLGQVRPGVSPVSHQHCQEPGAPGSLPSFSAFPVQKAGKLSSMTFSLHGRGPGQALTNVPLVTNGCGQSSQESQLPSQTSPWQTECMTSEPQSCMNILQHHGACPDTGSVLLVWHGLFSSVFTSLGLVCT